MRQWEHDSEHTMTLDEPGRDMRRHFPRPLSKHHGLGNDFLVALVDSLPLDAAHLASALCDRRRGIGADGLIFGVERPDGGVAMRLLNADGSPAEISGNGLRCLAQAVARRDGRPHLELEVDTPAGVRHCSVHATAEPHTVVVTVDMGVVCPGPDPLVDDLDTTLTGRLGSSRWETADVGNPHLVIEVDEPELVDLAEIGPELEKLFPEGANVHVVTAIGPDEILLRVWERGVGLTEACGSGATAAAWVFNRWGRVGERVVVRMPGGDALVELGAAARLTGPATHVADIVLPGATADPDDRH